MTAKPKKDPLAILMALPGVGKATAKKLNDAGFKTAASIVKAGQKGLIKAGLSAVISKKLLSAVTKKSPAKKAATKKPTAKKPTAKKSAAKKVVSKAKSTAKKAATKAKSTAKKAASKATASGRKVAEKSIKRTAGSMTVKSAKSTDGRTGKTLKVPRSVTDMPWFKKG